MKVSISNDNAGMSIVQVMVTVSVASLSILGIVTLLNFNTKMNRRATDSLEVFQLRSQVTRLLMTPEILTASMGTNTVFLQYLVPLE